jgi:hypothetical protein
VVEPDTDLLDWRPVPGSVGSAVTVSGRWTLTVDEQGTRAVIDGPTQVTIPAGSRRRVSDALTDGEYAVVVAQDSRETRPARATLVRLATGRRTVLDGGSPVPTTNGGTWALGEGHLLHATVRGSDYCLARVGLTGEAPESEVTWCALPRHGFSNARIAPEGDALLTFDDARPSCRTVASLVGDRVEAFPGVAECQGWEGVLLPGGRVWSVVPKETRIDDAHLYAARGDGFFDLGPGISGSLSICGGAAYFARDPGRDADGAQVLRWTADGRLSVVYEAPGGGEGFVTVPLRCGDTDLTLTALTEGGDEQVTARLR